MGKRQLLWYVTVVDRRYRAIRKKYATAVK